MNHRRLQTLAKRQQLFMRVLAPGAAQYGHTAVIVQKLRKALDPLFTRYRVQVVFAGHDHVYERTIPQQGVQYFITGAGGQIRRGDIDKNSPLRAASFDRDNSFMYLEVGEDEMSFKSISEKGEVVDSGVIKQA